MISNRPIETDFEDAGPGPGLPQRTRSLCPECLTVLPAVLYERDQKVWMSKTCQQHGRFVELISSDAAFFEKMDRWRWDTPGVDNDPVTRSERGCPFDCGVCPSHKSAPIFINIDLTNRCNLRCPVCFANADASGKLYEVSVEQVEQMMEASFKLGKIRPSCVQFSGGEPTLHRDFIKILRLASKRGYAQIQVATNGLKFARDPAFAQAAAEAGLNVVYLQFDGVSDEVYLKTRGRALWDVKQRAIENIAKAGMQVCLVPTLIKGVNDHQIGDIFRFAVDNIDVTVSISWQPVAFTGRIPYEKRLAMRFTIADLARALDEQTDGQVQMYRDWYPLSFVIPFSKLIAVVTGEPTPLISCHPHCGSGSYLIVDRESKQFSPLPAFVDVEPLMSRMNELANRLAEKRWFKRITFMRVMKDLPRYFHVDRALKGWDSSVLLEFMESFVDFRQRFPDNRARLEDMARRPWRYLSMVGMHFQDAYNYQLRRVQRCVIHYAAPNGRFYPFCTYNCGPVFRDRVEEQFSRPLRKSVVTAGNRNKKRLPAPAAAPGGGKPIDL